MSDFSTALDPTAEGFQPPDYSSDVDFDRQISLVPESGTTKGMFFSDLIDEIRKHAPESVDTLPLAKRRYIPFSDYSQRDYYQLLREGVRILHPNLPSGEALRRLAWTAFPRFVNSMVGRIVVGIFLDDIDRTVAAMAKAYQYCATPGTVDAVQVGERHWQYEVRDMPGAMPPFLAGATEGVLRHYEMEPRVLARRISPTSFDLSVQWKAL